MGLLLGVIVLIGGTVTMEQKQPGRLTHGEQGVPVVVGGVVYVVPVVAPLPPTQ